MTATSWSLETVTLYEKKYYSDVIKDFKMGDCPGLSTWVPSAIRWILRKGTFQADTGEPVNRPWKQRLKRCSHKPRPVDSQQRLEKTGKRAFLEPPERTQPCSHPDLSPLILILGFWPPELWQQFLIYCISDLLGSYRKLTHMLTALRLQCLAHSWNHPKFQTEGVKNRALRPDKTLCGDAGVLKSICDLQQVESENKQKREYMRSFNRFYIL